jgi:hypothetical protein
MKMIATVLCFRNEMEGENFLEAQYLLINLFNKWLTSKI